MAELTLEQQRALARARARVRAAQTPQERARANRPTGYDDVMGAAATYAHGGTVGTADEIAGAFGGAGGAVQGFVNPESISDQPQPRGGRMEAMTAAEIAAMHAPDSLQSAAGRLIDAQREDAPAPHYSPDQERRQTEEIAATLNHGPTLGDRLGGAARGATQGYNDTAGRFRRDYEQFYAEHPNEAAGTELTGALLSPVNRLRLGAGVAGGSRLPVIGGDGLRELARGGAIWGGLYTLATGDSWDPQDENSRINPGRLLTGTGTGAVLGPAFGVAGRTAGAIGGRFGLNANQRAVRMIARGLRDARMPPGELARRARTLRSQGGPTMETIAEAGGPALQRQARAVANVRGPGQTIAADALEGRTETVTPRVLSEATRATRPQQTRAPRNFYDAREQLRIARSGQGADAYRAAHAVQIPQDVVQRELMPLMQTGPRAAVDSAINQLESSALRAQSELAIARRANDAAALQRAQSDFDGVQEALTQLRAVRSGQAPNNMSVRALDYYQRGLGQLAANAGYRSPEGAAMEQARTTFNSLLDQVAPEFGQARTNYGASLRIEERMNDGRRVFNMPEGELDILLRGPQGRGLSMEEFDGFMLGVLDAIETKVRQGDTAFVARFMRNENWQRQLERALGKNGARRLRNRIAREASMRRFDNSVRSGSQTTPMAEDIRALTQGEDELNFLSEVIQAGGNVRGPLLRAGAAAYDRIRKPGIYNERVNEALARRLYSRATPGNIAGLENEIAALPGYTQPGASESAVGRLGSIVGATEPQRQKMRRVGHVSFAE